MATIPSDGSPMLGEHIFSAEDAAFEKRTLLNILDSIHESILIIDAQTRVCYVNDSYLKMFGIQREKIIGRHLAKFEPPGPGIHEGAEDQLGHVLHQRQRADDPPGS